MTKRVLLLAASVVVVVALNGLLPFKTAQASIGGTIPNLASGASVIVYENTNTVAGATFDFGVSVSGNGISCADGLTVTFSWTDAAKNAQSLTVVPCGSLGVRTTLPAMPKGGPAPAITLTTGNGSFTDTVAWTVEQVR